MPSRITERILDQAIALFNENGASAITTNHISKALGISPGNLYYHYQNKEEIIRAIYFRMVVEMDEVWNPTSNGESQAPLDALNFLLEKTYLLMWEYRFFQREVNALLRKDEILANHYRKMRKKRWLEISTFFQSLVDLGVLTDDADSKVVSKLSKIGWMIADYWPPFLEVEGRAITRESAREGVELIMSLLKPYLSDDVISH